MLITELDVCRGARNRSYAHECTVNTHLDYAYTENDQSSSQILLLHATTLCDASRACQTLAQRTARLPYPREKSVVGFLPLL